MAALEPRVGPERLLDLMLRTGPYGDGFGARDRGPGLDPGRAGGRARTGSTSARCSPACPTRCAPPSGTIELAPELLAGPTCRGCAPRWIAPPTDRC